MIVLCAISSGVRIMRHHRRIINDNTWMRKSATMCSVSRDIDSYFRSSIIYPPRTVLVRRIHEYRRASGVIYEPFFACRSVSLCVNMKIFSSYVHDIY